MKKILCLVIAIILMLICVGCGSTMQTVEDTKESTDISMFVLVEIGGTYKIVYHKGTKVMYAISNGDYNRGAFTIMLDADGNPLLWER